MTVRPASRADRAATAAIHARWLPTGFFPRLGRCFLRAYHATFAASPHAVALIAERGGATFGFLVGTVDNEQHYRWVARRRSLQLGVRGAAGLLRDRAVLSEFIHTRALRYARGLLRRLRRRPVTVMARCDTQGATPRRAGTVAVLTHVAVAPAARRCGAGRQLVEEFVERARAAQASEVCLVSPVETGAAEFYRTLGWRSCGVRPARAGGGLVEEFRLEL